MGSGCYSIPVSNNCGTPISSNCVQYMGDPVPALGICTGDTITEVESVLIDKIQSALDGTGITLSQVTVNNCAYLTSLFAAKDNTLANILQLLVDASCDLKSMIDQINTTIASSGYTFNLGCLPTVSNPTPNNVLQQLITSFCSLSTTVNNIITSGGDTTIINDSINTALLNLVTSAGSKGIKRTVDANGLSSYYFYGLTMPYMVGFYVGSLSVFDNTGLGIAGTYAEGYAIMNGLNGTPFDMRGFVGVGAIQNVPGPALDSLVNPNTNNNATMNYTVGDKGGQAFVSLSADQNGPHTHSITQTPHSHGYTKPVAISNSDKSGSPDYVAIEAGTTDGALANITINNSGLGSGHENRMPYRSGVWVMRLNT